jgi:hypothetical protein
VNVHVDIYRRSEPGNKYSYLLVPRGQPIPEEATNIDWALRQRDVAIDDAVHHLSPYEIDEPRSQIEEKGYAITSVMHQVEASRADAP